jgi:uncharacterized protein YfkK (UPF0435 family)
MMMMNYKELIEYFNLGVFELAETASKDKFIDVDKAEDLKDILDFLKHENVLSQDEYYELYLNLTKLIENLARLIRMQKVLNNGI